MGSWILQRQGPLFTVRRCFNEAADVRHAVPQSKLECGISAMKRKGGGVISICARTSAGSDGALPRRISRTPHENRPALAGRLSSLRLP